MSALGESVKMNVHGGVAVREARGIKTPEPTGFILEPHAPGPPRGCEWYIQNARIAQVRSSAIQEYLAGDFTHTFV